MLQDSRLGIDTQKAQAKSIHLNCSLLIQSMQNTCSPSGGWGAEAGKVHTCLQQLRPESGGGGKESGLGTAGKSQRRLGCWWTAS